MSAILIWLECNKVIKSSQREVWVCVKRKCNLAFGMVHPTIVGPFYMGESHNYCGLPPSNRRKCRFFTPLVFPLLSTSNTCSFLKIYYKSDPVFKLGPNATLGSISFHLSHQPPLSGMCHFYVSSKNVTFGPESVNFTTKKRHMPNKGGWWLTWKPLLPWWRIGP